MNEASISLADRRQESCVALDAQETNLPQARVSLARAVYSDSDVVLLDDCLSAVDAHTGKALVDRCLLGTLADKTRILVTHALHVLDKADYIYVMDEGRIVEEGTFNVGLSCSS